MRKGNTGFTLIELMIAVAIIAILAIYAVPNFVYYRNQAIIAGAIGSCESIRTAMAAYATSSDSALFPVGKFNDGAGGWESFRQFMVPLGTTLKNDIKEQGFQDFSYQTFEVGGLEGSDYLLIFETAGSPVTQTGALLEVRNDGIYRWTGSL